MAASTPLLQQARQLAAQGDHPGARAVLVQLLRGDTHNTDAWWLLANVTLSTQERQKALKNVLRLQPDHSAARDMLIGMAATAPPQAPAPQTMTPTAPTYPQPAQSYAPSPGYAPPAYGTPPPPRTTRQRGFPPMLLRLAVLGVMVVVIGAVLWALLGSGDSSSPSGLVGRWENLSIRLGSEVIEFHNGGTFDTVTLGSRSNGRWSYDGSTITLTTIYDSGRTSTRTWRVYNLDNTRMTIETQSGSVIDWRRLQ